jgi:hypothetical protein
MHILIKKFSLSNPKEYEHFSDYKNDLIHILQDSYGKKFYGEDEFNRRIELKKINIVLAFPENSTTPVGCLVYKNSGKGSAIAVLKEYRQYQIASKLLDYVKNNTNYFFAEIDSSNLFMQKFLLRNGFNIVDNINTIKKNLEQEKDKIKFLTDSEHIHYYHIKFKRNIDKVRTFIMLDHSKK